jgi:hypothetical protein
MKLKRKGLYAITSIALAALVISGTFAWTNLDVSALNEWLVSGVGSGGGIGGGKETGGVLHDDFQPPNKDVYIENFGDLPLYVRVRLYEYMEHGAGAGLKDSDENKAVSVVSASNINDPTTWQISIPGQELYLTKSPYHEVWDWKMGGKKFFYSATTSDREFITDNKDYVDQKSPENLTVWDKNADNVPAKLTADAKVIKMADWIAEGSNFGSYWILDSDGWAYWGLPLQPRNATGLLLDKVIAPAAFYKDTYYGVNVVAQMATKEGDALSDGTTDDYTKFFTAENGGITLEAKTMLEKMVSTPNALDVVLNADVPMDEDTVYIGADGKANLKAYIGTGTGSTEVEWSITHAAVDPDLLLAEINITPDGNEAALEIKGSLSGYSDVTLRVSSKANPSLFVEKKLSSETGNSVNE